nr:VCBS domain-containing protein [Vibrio harveyi]
MTINGTNDAATVSSATVVVDETDTAITTSGTLTSTDVDNPDNAFTPDSITGTHGNLTIDANGHWVFTANSVFNQLNVGDKVEETFTVTSVDGTPSTIKVTINGTNDAATVSRATVAVDETDKAVTTFGTLTSTDVDNQDNAFTASTQHGTHGDLTIDGNGHWVFTANSEFNQLNVGDKVEETFTVTSVDGTPSTIKVTINGTNDAATVSSATVVVDETDTAITTSGTLTSTDVDNPDNAFTPASIAGNHGDLTIDSNGHWVFTANSAFNQLNVGDKVDETFTVASVDGTQSTIKVTINGTNDRPTISGTSSGAVIEQGLNTSGAPDATGSLTATDLDKSDTVTWAINQPQGQWGTLSIDQNGHWHYQLDNSTGGAADKLAAGEHQSESFWITATDSAGATVPHKIVIDVQGSNDKPIVSAWTQLPAGKEDQPVTIKASDLLTHASDIDSSDVLHVTNLQATHGSLTDNKDGTYTFTPDKDFNGEIRLTYDVVDGHGGSVSTQAKFDLTATPDNAIITDAQTNADLRGVTEDRGYIDTHYQLHYDGKLNIQDPDAGEAQFDPNIGPQTYQGIGYDTKLGGHILLMRDGHYTYTLDNRNIQNLAQGEVKHDSAIIRSADGTTHTIELTVHGTNDAPTINAQSHSVTEGGSVLNGQMVGHDIDRGATLTYSIANPVDGLTFNVDGSYSFDPSNASYNHLPQGKSHTLTIPVTVTDEHGATSTQNLEIVVTGTNDAAKVSGVDTGSVHENQAGQDMSPDYAQPGMSKISHDGLMTSGQLSIIDPDSGEAGFDTKGGLYSYHGQYGHLLLREDGHWDYKVAAGQTDWLRQGASTTVGTTIDKLGAGETLTDTITIQTKDGTSHDIIITIHGDNDAPYVSGEVQLNSGKEDLPQIITQAELLANSIDVDHNDIGQLNMANLYANHGSILDNKDGTYTFTPDRDYNGKVHFTYDVKDTHGGTTHTGASTTLVATPDKAIISEVTTGSVIEDRPHATHNNGTTTELANGQLQVIDPDSGEDKFQYSQFGETRLHDPFSGMLRIDSAGNWGYSVDNAALQHLAQGQVETVTYRVHSFDGTAYDLNIDVVGTNDAPTVTKVVLSNGTEDINYQMQASQFGFTDVDTGDTLHSIAITDLPPAAQGKFVLDGHDITAGQSIAVSDIAKLQFVPTPNFNGDVQFKFTVNDGHVDSQEATNTLHIDAVSDAAQFTGGDTGDVHEGHTYTAPDGSMSGGYVNDRSPDHMHGNVGKIWNDEIHTDGHLNIVDPDSGESHAKTGTYQGTHGHVILQSNGDWSYYASIGQDATGRKIDHLGQGESITDTVTVKSADGTTHDIHITIHGDNDRPYCSSEVQLNSGKEDLAQTITTTELLANTVDVDTNDAGQLSIANLHADHGTLVDNKDGTFTFTPDHNFNGKVHFTYDVKDAHGGVTHTGASTTLLPSNDAATLQPTLASNFVTEDHLKSGTSTNELWSGWKNLDIQDIDSPSEAKVTQIEVNGVKHTVPANFAMNLVGVHGTFNFTHSTDGHDKWSYSADNSHAEVQSLSHGDSLTDTITLITADGTRIPLTAKILGTDDHVIIDTPDALTAALGTAIEDKVTSISGTLLAHDSDSKDSVTFSAGDSTGAYGTLHVDSNGQWHYDLDHSKANALQQGETKAEGFDITAISTDGSTATKHIEVLVQGSNDKATISVNSNPDVHEDSSSTPVEIISGKLSALDPDHDQSAFSTDVGKRHDPFNSGVHGGLHISKDGSWTYTVNNSQIQQLAAGQEEHVQYNVHTVGGDYHVIDIKIVGTNDIPTVSATTLVHGTEDTHYQMQASQFGFTDIDTGDTLHSIAITDLPPATQGKFVLDGHDITAGQSIATADIAKLQFVPATDFNGDVQFKFTVNDGHASSAEATNTLHIDAVSDAALITGSGSTLKEDVNLGTAPGDRGKLQAYGQLIVVDPDGPVESGFEDPLTAGLYKGSLGGSLQVNPDGQYMYSLGNFRVDYLKEGDIAHDRFTVHSLDGTTHTLEFKIQGTNDAPYIRGNLHHAVWEDEAVLHGQLNGTDTDAGDQQHLLYSTTAHVAGFHLNADGSYTFDPSDSAYQHLTGRDIWGSAIKIPVTVTDQDGLSTTQNLSISVMGRNDAPVVSADVQLASGSEDTTVTIHASDLLTNATDVDDSETLSLSISGLSSDHGSITDNHDGTYTFTPDPDYNGPVQFSYAVKDRNGASTPAHATLALVPVDDKTQFSGVDHGVATEDVATHMSTNVNIMDAVDWQALQIKDVDSPNKQVTVEFAGQQYTWNLGSDLDVMTPYGKFQFHTIKSGPHTGEHSWSYIGDNNNVHVQELKHGESVTESIKLIATDGTEFPITVKVSGTEDGVVIDSKSELGHVIENAQTGASVAGSVAAHDTDLHDSVSWTATPKGGVSGQYGSFHLSADGQWHYDVDQSKATKLGDGDEYWEHFTIEAVSTDGSKVSQRVSVVVRGNNDVPVVSGEVTLPSGKEDSSIHLTQAQLVSNVTDIDSNDRGWLHAQNLTVDHGNVIANSDGSFTFNPDPNYNGSVHFTYDVADRHGGVTHTGANTTIAAINDAARFKGDDTGSVTEDQNVHPSVQGNYSNKLEAQGHLTAIDPDAGESGFDYHTLISTPSHPNWAPYRSALGGELEIDQQGRWHYYIDNRKPEVQSLGAGETLTDTVTVHSKDGTTHDITLTIHGTNDDPVVSVDVQLGAGREDTTHIITSTDLLTHASDLDKNDLGQLSVTHLSVDHGSILDNGDGTFTLVPEPDYNGQLHFQYQVNDAHGGKAHASASMSVAAVNDRPNVQPLTDSVKEDSTSSHLVDLLTGATDKEGDVLSVSHITYSVDGSTQTSNVPDGFALGTDGHSLVIDVTHSAFQHLAARQTQQVLVNYLVGDGHGGQTQQSATLTIEGTDDKAVLTSNVIQMTESEALKSKTSVYQGNLQLTDPDTGDHTQFAFSGHYMGQGYAPGSLYIWPDGSYEFRMESATNRHADDLVDSLHKGESLEFPYQIRTSDGQRLNIIVKVIGEDDNARITVGQYSSLDNHANEDNIAPGGTHNQVWSGGNLHVIDPDHGQAGFVTQSFDTPEGGHFSINVRGGWQYTIDNAKLQHLGEGQSYQKTFTVESIDGTAQQTITVTVHGTNDTPVVTSAVSLSQGVEDTPVTLKAADLLAHASDVDDHSQLSVHNLSVDHGQVVDNLDGTFNFTPEKNYHGQVQFTYDVKDEHGASVSTSATMSLSAVNDAATFTGDSGSIDEDTNIHHNVRTTGSATIADALVCHGHLIVSDADGHGEAALDLKGQQKLSQDGTYGHFDITSRGTWVYIADNKSTPIQDLDNGQTLTDSIEITSQDGTKHSITVTISGSTDRPTIHSFTDSGVQSTGPIEGNLISGVGTSQGTAAAATDSDSNAHLILQDIQIKDPVSGSYVTVTPGHPHAIAGIGTLAIEANGHYIFTPEAGFTGKVPTMVYRVGDDGGTPVNDSSQNTLSIEVKPPAQHAPTVTPQTVTSDEDQSHTFTAAEFGYQDADHDALNHITITQLPSHGLLTLNGLAVTANQQVSKAELDAGHLTFTPVKNQSGTNYAHFEFSANDGHQDSASASMIIDVNAINDVPTVGSSFTSLLEDTPHNFTKADFKYADVDGDLLHHITITNIAHGSLTLNGRAVSVGDDVAASDLASLVYTPAQNYHSVGASGLGGIQFTANDGHTDSKSGMYLINIVAVPDPATFIGDSTGHAQEDTHTQASGTLSVTDPDGSQGFISVQGGVGIVGSKGYGHAHIDSNGHWTYNLYNNHAIVQQLKQGQTDTETITVQAKDGTTHDIIITITGTNDAPTVSEHPPGSSHSVNEDTNQNARGQLDINDIDGDAVGVTVDPSHSAQFGSVQFDSQTNTWAYHLDNANPQVDALNDGDTLTDRFTLLVDDGHGGKVSKEIVMTINGHTDPIPYTPPTISVTVDTRNAHHVTAGITVNTVQAYAHSIGQSVRTVSGHHEIEGHGNSEVFIVQGSLHEEAELKSGNDILYIGGRLTDEEIEGGSGRDTLILGAYNRNNAPKLHSDKIGNMEIESIENIILGDGTVLKGQLPPNFPLIGYDHYEVPVNIQAHLSSSDDSVSSIRLTHLQQGLTLQSNGHNINANQDGSYTVPANGHFVVISTHPISSGHHYFETEVTTYNSVTGVTAVTTEDLHGHIQSHVNPPPPPPPPVQHDEPDFTPLDGVQDFTVTSDVSSSADSPLDGQAQIGHEHATGAAAYLDALGITPPHTDTDTSQHTPADLDIVLAQVDQQHTVDYDQAHLDMSDALEHHDAANNHNQDDEHHHQNDVDGLPDIDPNN